MQEWLVTRKTAFFGLPVLLLCLSCVESQNVWAQGTLVAERAKPAAGIDVSKTPPANATAATTADSVTAASPNTQKNDHQGRGSDRSVSFNEDWKTPSLAGSKLVAQEPILGEIDDHNPAFTREMIQVQWRPGDPIYLYVMKPKGVQKPSVILYLYSYPSDAERFGDDNLCKFLTKNGFAAVGFAASLDGHRYHDVPLKKWFVSELPDVLVMSAHDVQMVLNYLGERGDFDMSRVGMFGDGSGATIAILAAAVDPRIKILDLLDPWGDWPNWMAQSTRIPEKERPDCLKPEYLARVAAFDPVKWLPQLKTQKIRLQSVMTVTVTPDIAKQHIEAAAPPNAKVIRYDDGKALLKATSGGTALEWIKEQLQPGPSQQYRAAGDLQTQKSADAKRPE
jgi:hypothetical protein